MDPKSAYPVLARFQKITLFFHPAKSGGSSIAATFLASERYEYLEITAECQFCGPECEREARGRKLLDEPETIGPSSDHLIFSLGHATLTEFYSFIAGYKHFVESGSEALIRQTISLIVPWRRDAERILSAYKYYWGMAEGTASNYFDEEAPLHRKRASEAYSRDSFHYITNSGSIDVEAWFEAFSLYGPGIPFYSRDVFSSEALTKIENLGVHVQVIASKNIRQYLKQEFGEEEIRSNVSSPSGRVNSTLVRSKKLASKLSRQKRQALSDRVLLSMRRSPFFSFFGCGQIFLPIPRLSKSNAKGDVDTPR